MRWPLGLSCALIGTVSVLGADPVPHGFSSPSPARSARLLIPQPYDFPETQVIRAQADSPPPLGMTPVRRSLAAYSSPAPSQPASPAWLRGVAEPESIVPAAASLPSASPTPRSTLDTPSRRTHWDNISLPIVRLFSTTPPTPVSSTPAATTTHFPHAQTPFRGTNAQGATIYAGPPAYRWYGYGATTPPAFLIQSQGQYPRASADWYHITGATAGAFPVPVLAPPTTTVEAPSPSVTSPQSVTPPPASMGNAPTTPGVLPPPIRPTPAVLQQSNAAPLTRNTEHVMPQSVISPPAPDPRALPTPISPLHPSSVHVSPATVSTPAPHEANRLQPAIFPTLPPSSPLDSYHPPLGPASPVPTPEHSPWKPAAPRSGREAFPSSSLSNSEPVRRDISGSFPVIARGQLGETPVDFTTLLLEQITAGQARHLQVRWISPTHLEIAWESSHPTDAERLVRLISAHPDLAPFHLDFRITIQ
jgi:hypothetical protein